MDLHTAQAVVRVTSGPDRLHWPAGARWQPGDVWLAGGSWLFSESQPDLRRLIDLGGVDWPAIVERDDGIELAATCTLAELVAWGRAAPGPAGRLAVQCCESLRGSFKVWNTATVGGNLSLALPAGPIISLTAALDGELTLWDADGGQRTVKVVDFITGAGTTAIRAGELIRSVFLPRRALDATPAFRQLSLRNRARSAVLLIGLRAHAGFALTVTAATTRPHRFTYAALPDAAQLQADLDGIADWFADVHGTPPWRAHLTRMYAEQIRQELA